MDYICKVDKANAQEWVVDDFKQLSFVEIDFVFEQHIQVGLDVLHYHAYIEISVWVIRLKHINQLGYQTVISKKLEL